MDIASLGIKIQTTGAKEAAADLDKLQASAARTEATVKKVGPTSRTSAEALQLFAKIDPAAGKLASLDSLEASLTKLSKAGKVGADDFAAMSAKIAENRAKIVGESAAVAEASTLVQKFTANTRLMSEASTIASDVVSGQFGRIRRSAAAMANASGVFRLAFSGAGAAILGTVAALGALAIAYEKGSQEQEDFNKALILTGNYAGTTAIEMQKMAESLDGLAGVTQHEAASALTAVAESGKFTADQFELVAGAALKWQIATGQAVDKTIEQFEKLRKDPINAILDLNDAQHFLTQETLKQIESLVEQGRQTDAARLAIETYANSLNAKSGQITQNLGAIETGWKIIKDTAAEAWDAMLGIGRTQTIEQRIASVQEQIARAQARGFSTAGLEDQLKQLKATPNFANVKGTADGGTVDSDQARASIEFQKEGLRYATERQRMEHDIADARALGVKAGKSEAEIDQRIAAIRADYARKGPKGGSGGSGVALEGAQSKAALQAFEDELKREQGAIANQTQLLDANYAARNISAEKYYAEQKRLSKAANDAQITALTGEISVLQSRNVKGKQSVNNARELAEKEAELAKVRADGATKAQVLDIQEAALLRQRQQANQAYKDALDQNANALKADFDSQVLRVGMGEREFEIQSKINELYRDEAKELLNLARARDANELDPTAYEQRVAQLKASTEQEVQIVRDGYARMSQAQANWQNGAIKAFDDYRDAANDVAGQVGSIFSDAFNGLENVLTDFFTKGKADWKGFLDSIAAEITRFIIKQQLSKWLGGLFNQQGGGSSEGGWLSSLVGLFSGGGGEQIYAKGGAFENGVQKFAYGGVISSPTNFAMANNRLGLMGEAGPEAILPLHRGPDGKLGVRLEASNDSRASGPTVVNQTVVVQGRMDSRTADQIGQSTARAQNRASVRNR